MKKSKKENDSILILMYLPYIILNDDIPPEIILYIINFYDLLFKNRSYYRIKKEPNFKHREFIYYDWNVNEKKYITKEDIYVLYCILNEDEEKKYNYTEKLTMNCYLVTWEEYILFPSEKRAIYTFIIEKSEKSLSCSFLIHPNRISNLIAYGFTIIEKDIAICDYKYDLSTENELLFVDTEKINLYKCRDCLTILDSLYIEDNECRFCNKSCLIYYYKNIY